MRFFRKGSKSLAWEAAERVTKFVCGYMACEPQVSRLVLAGLPPLLKIKIRDDPSGVWLENLIRFSVANTGASTADAKAVLAKLPEALFVETCATSADRLTGRSAGSGKAG